MRSLGGSTRACDGRTRTSTDEHGQTGEGVWHFARPSSRGESVPRCPGNLSHLTPEAICPKLFGLRAQDPPDIMKSWGCVLLPFCGPRAQSGEGGDVFYCSAKRKCGQSDANPAESKVCGKARIKYGVSFFLSSTFDQVSLLDDGALRDSCAGGISCQGFPEALRKRAADPPGSASRGVSHLHGIPIVPD